jgi:hypothetical protein
MIITLNFFRRNLGGFISKDPLRVDFNLSAPYQPIGDQPQAITTLLEVTQKTTQHRVLLGAAGTGKRELF